jgi:putative endopeptidase
MSPQTINAYYNPNLNEIVFPAAIIQEPFFSLKNTDSENYGGIGAIIGHEITHAFDDVGRKYDAYGNLNNWWTENDIRKFNNESKKIIKQYNNYKIKDLNVNGKITLGENIADIGGLKIAFEALLIKNPKYKTFSIKKEIKSKNDFTPIQHFFLAFGNSWRCLITQEEKYKRIKSDVHSPNDIRVNGTLSVSEDFYKAFDVKNQNKMFMKNKDKGNIW